MKLRGHISLLLTLVCLPLLAQMPDSLAVEESAERLLTADAFQPDSFLLEGNVVEEISADTSEFAPDSNKALWYAALFPGAGQFYNRRYWKLPIVAGAAAGLTYAISWNNRYYEAYTTAYHDLIDNDPSTNYFNLLIPAEYNYSSSQLNTTIKNRQQTFRRQRDLCIIIAIGCYLVSILDAYVDAELFNFDISDDLSFEWGAPESPQSPIPGSLPSYTFPSQTLGVSWSIKF